MMTAKIFENGRSQAVRLPKEYRFSSNEVAVNKIGNVVMLMPIDEAENKWAMFSQALDMFSDDFMEDGRTDLSPQKREEL